MAGFAGTDIDQVDYEERIDERQMVQYVDKPRLRAFLSAVAAEAQELEQAFLDILQARLLDSATGESLLQIARIVVQPITTDDVDTIRLLIRTRIATRKSHGRIDDLLNVLRTFIPDEERTLTEYFPACILVGVPDNITEFAAVSVTQYLADATAAGVCTYVVYILAPAVSGDEIRFSDAADWPGGSPPTFSDAAVWPAGAPRGFTGVVRR